MFVGTIFYNIYAAIFINNCREANPIFGKLSTEYPDIKFIQVDFEYFASDAAELKVTMVPTFKFINERIVVCTVKLLLYLDTSVV